MMNTPDDILGETIRVTDAMCHNDRMIRTARTQREFNTLLCNAERLELKAIKQRELMRTAIASGSRTVKAGYRPKPVFGGRP